MPTRIHSLPKGVPSSLKFGSVAFKVFSTGDGRLGFLYKDGSQWKQVLRRDFVKLKRDADRIALALLNAETAALDMTAEDRRIYITARTALAPMNLDVDRAVRLFIEAAQTVGGHDHLIEACRFFAKGGPVARNVATAEIVAHFQRHLASDGVSAIYLRKMGNDLDKFAAKFPTALSAVRAAEMEEWLRAMPVGLRRRRNLRDKLVAIFNFARDHEYLPSGLRTEAEKIKRPKIQRKAPAIYTPEELDLILTQCAQPADAKLGRGDYTGFIPALCIGSFAGLRWAEILRLDWSHVHFADGVIEVGEENKTGYRLVPIEPNLASWLSPYRDARGPVCKYKRPDHVLTSLRARAGLPGDPRRYQNAPRHSYVTYLVATTKNMPLVAGNSGHSVAELRRSYHRASLESAGKRWFGISRDSANVIQMPLGSFRLG